MSKVMQREMTVTTCKVAKTVIGEGGFPALQPMEDQTIIGAVTQAQADKIIKERLAQQVKDGAPEGCHIHYDESNSLEDESIKLVIQKTA